MKVFNEPDGKEEFRGYPLTEEAPGNPEEQRSFFINP